MSSKSPAANATSPRGWWCACGAALIVVALLVGCGSQGPSLLETVLNCAELPGAKTSENEPLRMEVLRIEEARQTPKLLAAAAPDPKQNAAALLAESLSDQTRLRLFPKLDDLVPDERFLFDTAQLEGVRKLLNGTVPLRMAIKGADKAQECVFDVQNEMGYFAPMRFLDDAAIAARLHLLAAVPALKANEIAAVIDDVDAALRWVNRLAAVGRIESRLRAAQLRGETLLLIEALADSPATQRPDFERLYALLRRSLDNWPPDSAPLIGDRAVSLHTYEAIRAGLFEQLVTAEETQLLESRGLLGSMKSMGATQIDLDQLAYLAAMRELIDQSEKPYHDRVAAIEEVMKPFQPEEPRSVQTPLAANLMLPGLPHAMREIAIDRAACEVWAIALAAAAEIDLPAYQRNPVTGEDYKINRIAGGLIVRTGDPELRDAYSRTAP